MAITINGSGTITGVSAGGLPDGIITADELASGVGGKVLQVVTSSTTTNSSSNSSTAYDTGLTATITPSSTSSKILILTDQSAFWNQGTTNNYADYGYLVRGSTTIGTIAGQHNNNTGQGFFAINFVVLDSPNTTSATTYKTQARSTNSDTLYINWDSESRITLIEVAG